MRHMLVIGTKVRGPFLGMILKMNLGFDLGSIASSIMATSVYGFSRPFLNSSAVGIAYAHTHCTTNLERLTSVVRYNISNTFACTHIQ